MASFAGANQYLNTFGALSTIDNDPVGARDLVAVFRGNLSLELGDYSMGQALTGAAGLNVGDMWYPTGSLGPLGALTTVTTVVGTLTAVPFFTGNQPLAPLILNALGLNVTTAGGTPATSRAALYANQTGATTTMYPGALIAGTDTGNIVTTSTGFVSGALAPAIPLTPNTLYWIAVNNTWTTTATQFSSMALTQQLPIFGYTAANPPAPRYGWTVAFAYAAMPATFPVSATLLAALAPLTFARFA